MFLFSSHFFLFCTQISQSVAKLANDWRKVECAEIFRFERRFCPCVIDLADDKYGRPSFESFTFFFLLSCANLFYIYLIGILNFVLANHLLLMGEQIYDIYDEIQPRSCSTKASPFKLLITYYEEKFLHNFLHPLHIMAVYHSTDGISIIWLHPKFISNIHAFMHDLYTY